MVRTLLCAVAIIAMLAVVSACVSQRSSNAATATMCEPTAAYPGSGFPNSFDYPQAASTIKGWKGQRQRVHAYCLFAGLNYPWVSGKPLWTTWYTATQAFPYEYNPWPLQAAGKPAGAEGMPAEHAVPINLARSRASGPSGAIINHAPKYYVNAAVANNPAYRAAGCLQANRDENNHLLGYTLADGKVFQSNGDIMIAAVSYNPFALQSILGNQLYDATNLDKQLPPQVSSPANSIGPMDQRSIVLKVMLWPVSGTSPTALPIWNWNANRPGHHSDGQYAGYEMQNFWTKAVAITNGPAPPSVTFLYGVLDPKGRKPLGPNTYESPQAVGLDRFYSKTYSAGDLLSLSPCDQAILDAAAWWAYNRSFQPGDSLVLIAMHMMTKEQPDWTFQSAWWHPGAFDCKLPDDPIDERFCRNRPTSVRGGDTTYKNYMMATTYGQEESRSRNHNDHYYAPPNSIGKLWPVAYNPYIELAASHPITTNCMNCHHRAAWPPNTALFPSKKDPDPQDKRYSAYLQPADIPHPNVLEVFDSQNRIFNGLLMVDSMWAVSDRAGYPAIQPAEAKSRE